MDTFSTFPRADALPQIPERPDWTRIFPDADHRWVMGLRPGDSADFFAPRDTSSAVCAERAHWLAEDALAYAALLPGAGLMKT